VSNELSVQPTLKKFVLGFTVHLIFSQYTQFHLFEYELFQSMNLSYRLAIFYTTFQPVFSSYELYDKIFNYFKPYLTDEMYFPRDRRFKRSMDGHIGTSGQPLL